MGVRKKVAAARNENKVHLISKQKLFKPEVNESCETKNGGCVLSGSALICISIYSCVVLAVYIYTMYPSISGGDSGELMAAAHELGVAHPPGYPLFTLLSWLTIQIVPYGTVAWRMNLLNAIFSAIASVFFSLTVHRYTGSVGCALAGTSLWCFSKLTWTWSTMAEVFGLNNLFTSILLYLMVVFQDKSKEDKPWTACLGSFVCALSLCNQHTMVVYVFVIALWVVAELFKLQQLTHSLLLQLGICFLCGLVPYLYLPLSSYYSNGRWTWGDQRSFEGFFRHVLRTEYGTFDLAMEDKDNKGSTLFEGLSAYSSHLWSEFTVSVIVLAFLGAVDVYNRCHVKRQMSLLVSVVMCSLYQLLFSWRANLDIENRLYLGVVERFWMQSDCVVVLLAAVGLSYVLRFIGKKCSTIDSSQIGIGFAIGVCALQMQRNFSTCNQRENTVIREFGMRLINNMPPNTFVFTIGDLPSNVLRYLYLCENQRPDIQVFDQEILTYQWSVELLRDSYPGISFPGHHMARIAGTQDGLPVFNSKTFLDANFDKGPIIGCIGVQSRERSWQTAYQLFPFGPCQRIIRNGAQHHVDSLVEGAWNISAEWMYPYQGFDDTSWERVATDEMWNAKIAVAAYLYDSAVGLKNTEQMKTMMEKAYVLYKAAIDVLRTEDVPAYWHKNYALACEWMLNLNHEFSKESILNETIFHFQTFIDKDPEDKDVKTIKDAIVKLKGYIGMF